MKKTALMTVVLLLTVGFGARWTMSQEEQVIFAESEVEGRWEHKQLGTYVLIDGSLYKDHGGGKFSFLEKYYDPEFRRRITRKRAMRFIVVRLTIPLREFESETNSRMILNPTKQCET